MTKSNNKQLNKLNNGDIMLKTKRRTKNNSYAKSTFSKLINDSQAINMYNPIINLQNNKDNDKNNDNYITFDDKKELLQDAFPSIQHNIINEILCLNKMDLVKCVEELTFLQTEYGHEDYELINSNDLVPHYENNNDESWQFIDSKINDNTPSYSDIVKTTKPSSKMIKTTILQTPKSKKELPSIPKLSISTIDKIKHIDYNYDDNEYAQMKLNGQRVVKNLRKHKKIQQLLRDNKNKK